MKKKLVVASLLLFYSLCVTCSEFNNATYDGFNYNTPYDDIQEVSGRSYMFTRPIFAHTSTEQAIWHNFIDNKDGALGGNFQIIGAYQHSRTDTAIDRYFLLKCKNSLLVAGDQTSDAKCRDIRAEWLGLPGDFSGRFTVNPEQKQTGLTIEYSQDLYTFFNLGFFQDSWVTIQLPIVWAQNRMNLRQYNVVPGTQTNPNGPRDIIEAFAQPAWNFGKIVPQTSRCELGALIVQFGRSFLAEKNGMQISYYSGLVIPTSSKQNPEFLFDATTGYNGHVGINAGVRFNILLNKNNEYFSLCGFATLDDVFLIRNEQCRTLGLIDPKTRCSKPLSRFMLFNTRCPDQQNVPGVNVLTRTCRSRPYNIMDFNAGFRLTVSDWLEAECGYGIWGHGEEKVFLRNPLYFNENFGIAGSTVNSTADQSTIAQQAPDDAVFTPIRECDLDGRAASSGPTLNQKAFGSIGIQSIGKSIDGFFAAGWFLDFPHKNGALKTWGAWAKIGGSL